MKRPLVGIAVLVSLGILGAKLLDVPIFYFYPFALISLAVSLLFLRYKTIFLISASIGFLFLGAFVYQYHKSLPLCHIKNIISQKENFPKHILIKGRVANEPDKKLTHYNTYRYEFLVDVDTIKFDEYWQTAKGLILTYIYNPQINFRYGDEVILEGQLSVPRPATNPGQFDYKKFLERKKQFYILKVKETDFSKVLGRGRINPLKSTAYKVSGKIKTLIEKYIPPQEASILNALLLGRRSDIGDDITDDFINTGTVHILSISGLHVGLLAAVFMILFKLFRIPFRFWAFILAVFLIFYCAMTGNRPPVVRATIMLLVFLFARVLKREADPLNSLAFSALLILFFNPQALFDVGFQLSYLTMGSIVYFTPKIPIALPVCEISHTGSVERVKIYLLRALLVSVFAWLGSAPFIARYFNTISPVTILANLFIVPWMFFVMASALAFIILASISSLLGLIFSQAAFISIFILLKVVSLFSKIPFSYFRVKSPPWIFIAGFYIFLFLFFKRRFLKIKAKYFLITGLLFFNLFVWHKLLFDKRDFLKVTFLDVGKGDAIFLEFPNGGTMLIDGGDGLGVNMGRVVVSRFLAFEGINKIDVVLATHPHTDHIGGLVAVLRNFKVRYFIDNGVQGKNIFYSKCQTLIRQKGIKRFVVKRGDEIKGFGNTALFVLSPPSKKFSGLNDNSLVLKLKEGEFSILFCGDIEEEAAGYLAAIEGEGLSATVLKVPHHGGSMKGATAKFLNKVNPKIAVVSLGDIGINEEVLFVLKGLNTQLYRTDENGAVFLTYKKGKCSVSTFKKGLPEF